MTRALVEDSLADPTGDPPIFEQLLAEFTFTQLEARPQPRPGRRTRTKTRKDGTR